MIIAVAGPYSATTEAARRQNLDALNNAAARLLELGHIPIIGVNAALPVVDKAGDMIDCYQAIMDISMAVVSCCEALLMIGESPGANRERAIFITRGLPVYDSPDDVPDAL